MRFHRFWAAWFGRKATFIYAMLHCERGVASRFSRKSKTGGIPSQRSILARDTTLFAALKCLCVLKHIAGVHKVCLGEYTDTRTQQRRENIIRSTRERRQVAEQENIDKILLLDGDERGLKSGAVAIFRVSSNCCRTTHDSDVCNYLTRIEKHGISLRQLFFAVAREYSNSLPCYFLRVNIGARKSILRWI